MWRLAGRLQHHADEVSYCAFSASLLATGSGDKSLRLYKTAGLSELPCSPLSAHGYGVRSCCFTPCSDYLLSCSADGSVLVWSCRTGEVDSELRHPDRSSLKGASDGTLALWDFPSRALIRCGAVSEASVVACCFSPCGHALATGCTLGQVRLWDVDGALLHAEDAHDLGVTCCTFAPRFEVDGGRVTLRLASCGQDSRTKIWTVSHCQGQPCVVKLLHTLSSQSAPVLCCAFSSDGQLVVSGSVDKSVAVYDVEPGTLLQTLKQHDRYVTAVALSPSMPCVMATGSMDRTVNVWMLRDRHGATGAELEQTACQGRKPPSRSSRLLLPDWSQEDVQAWLHEERLVDELAAVFRGKDVDGAKLAQLSEATALEMGIDGFSYERESIESWIRGKKRSSPMTNLPLQTTLLTPNRALKMAISRWKWSQQPSS